MSAVLLVTPAVARDAPKAKPCPKGQAAAGKATGKQTCFEIKLPPMQPMTVEAAKPAPKKP
jgi:hypothetical protein